MVIGDCFNVGVFGVVRSIFGANYDFGDLNLCHLTEDSSKVATSDDQDRVFGKRQVLGSDHPLKKSLNNTNSIEFAKKVDPYFNHNTFPCPRSSQLESDGLKLGGGAM